MIKRRKILESPEYWFEHAQDELFRQLTSYMEREKLTQTQLAEKLGVTKGYISQILNGNFNYTLKKLIELSLAINLVPTINYQSIEYVVEQESNVKLFSLSLAESRRVELVTASESENTVELVGESIFRNTRTIRMEVA